MNSRQKNFTLWHRTNEIVQTVNKYNLASVLKEDEEVHQFILDETRHFPKARSLSFRAKAVACGDSCECVVCGTIVKEYGKEFCSKKCHGKHKRDNPEHESLEQITVRVPNLMGFKDADFPSGTTEPDDPDQFVRIWNRIRHLSKDELKGFGLSGDYPANEKSRLHVYLARIVTWNKSITDYYAQVVECAKYQPKTQNLEWYTLLYGEEEAHRRIDRKSERVQGTKNPGYQHGGKLSPFSKNFVRGDVRENTIEKAKASREASNGYTTRLSYWTERFGEEEGKRLYYDRQNTFSREKMISKYGEDEGIRRWNERQMKWMESLESLPEEEKAIINAKKGFWRYSDHDVDEEVANEKTTFYVINYKPTHSDREFVKVGVTNRNLTSRFPSICIKEKLYTHESNRLTNFRIERDVKRFIFENGLSILLESDETKFDGWTECVELEHKDNILDVIYETIRNYQ